jgi:hypothetical protein
MDPLEEFKNLYLNMLRVSPGTGDVMAAIERKPFQPVTTALDAAQAPARATQGLLAPAVPVGKALLRPPLTTENPTPFPTLRPEGITRLPAALREAQQTPMTQEAFRTGLEDLPFHTRLTAETVTDPLSYLGMGLPGKAAPTVGAGARMLGVDAKVAARIADMVAGLDAADTLLAEAPLKIAGGTAKTALGAVGSIPTFGTLKIMDSTGGIRGSQTLGEWATATSNRGWFKHFVREAANLSEHLQKGGHSLEEDMRLAGEYQAMRPYDVTPPVEGEPDPNLAHLQDVYQELTKKATSLTDPTQRTWAQTLMNEIEPPTHWPNNSPSQGAYEDVLSAMTGANVLMDTVPAAGVVTGPGRAGVRQVSFQSEAQRLLTRAVDEGRLVMEGKPHILASLPDTMHETGTREWGNFVKFAGKVQDDRQRFASALRDAWTAAHPGQQFPLANLDTIAPDQRYAAINRVLGDLGHAPAANPVDVLNSVRGHFMGDIPRVLKLEGALKRWPDRDLFGFDTKTQTPVDLYDLVVRGVSREKADLYKVVPDKNDVMAIFKTGTALWKETNLLSPTYPITNLVGGLFAGALEGVNPVTTLSHLVENVGTAMRDQPVVNSQVRKTLAQINMALPDGLTSGSGILNEVTPVKEWIGKGLTASQSVGSVKLGLAGAGVGALSGYLQSDVAPEDRSKAVAIKALEGGVGGAALPHISGLLLRRLTAGIETTLRQDAWHLFLMKGIAARQDGLLTDVQATLGPYGGRRGAAAFTAIQDRLTQNHGLISPQEVEATLNASGLNPARSRLVASRWESALAEASNEGMDAVSRIHVDYEVLNNADEAIRNAIPFSTWPVKMLPFFGKHLLERPSVLMSLVHLNLLSAWDANEKGLTPRFTGAVPIAGMGDALYSWALGHPVTAYYNPLRGLVPFSDTNKSLENMGTALENGDYVDAAMQAGGVVGLSPHPLIQYAMRLGSSEAPAQGMIRQGEPLRGVEAFAGLNQGRGFDLNAAFTESERAVRGLLHGEKPTDIRAANVDRRIDELAVRDTGKSIRSGDPAVAPYIAAKTDPNSGIWKQAAAEVARDKGAQSVVGFGSQILAPQTFLTPEEASIRGAQVDQRADPQVQQAKTIRDALAQLEAADGSGGKATPAPPEVQQAVAGFIEQQHVQNVSRGIDDKDDLASAQRMFRVGSVGAMQKVLDTWAPYPTDLSSGYASGGKPVQSELNKELATWSDPAAIAAIQGLPPDEQARASQMWQQYQDAPAWAKPRLRKSLNDILGMRDTYRKANPLLDAYMNARDANPNMDMATFLEQYRRSK